MDQEQKNLIVFLWKKRKPIILFTAIGAIVSLIVSFLITPQFLSTAIVYPTATSTVSFSEQRNAKASSMDFGEDEQAEQMLQVLQSSRIKDRIVQQFDLINHYRLKSDDKNLKYKLQKEYDSHISSSRTKFGSIRIDVLDEDPQMAADIANKMVDLYDTVMNEMIRERTLPAFDISIRKKQIIEQNMADLNKKLDSLSAMGVVADRARSNLFDAYNNAKTAEDKAFFKRQIDVNIQYAASYDGLAALRDELMVNISRFETAYEQAESDANTNLNHKFIVESAYKADKKETPKKMLIVLMATIGTFIFSIFFFLIKDKIEELKKIA